VRCGEVEARITGYLDGDLDDTLATAVRGHLRVCPACHHMASVEAQLIDELRALPSPDVPTSLWQRIDEDISRQEVALSREPRWRLWWRQYRRWMAPAMGLAVAAAMLLLALLRRHPQTELATTAARATAAAATLAAPGPSIQPRATPPKAAEVDARYQAAVAELTPASDEERATWGSSQAETFDATVAALRRTIAAAEAGRPRERAWQELVRVTQRAAVGIWDVGGEL
jgi:hypothetical protein